MAKHARRWAEGPGMARREAFREAIEREAARREAERKRNKKKGRAVRPKRKPATPPAVRDPALPPWSPAAWDATGVPDEVQQAARNIVQPVYEQFVLRAADGLEKSLGVTVAHLLWLEILEQVDMRREYLAFGAGLGLPCDRQDAIDQHLRLLGAKVRVGYFLARMRDLQQRVAAARQAESPGGGLWPALNVHGGELDPPAPRLEVAPSGANGNAQVLNPEPWTLDSAPSSDADRAKSTIR